MTGGESENDEYRMVSACAHPEYGPVGANLFNRLADYIRVGYMGSQPSSTEVHKVRSMREQTEGDE
jgi:hypothetical protein